MMQTAPKLACLFRNNHDDEDDDDDDDDDDVLPESIFHTVNKAGYGRDPIIAKIPFAKTCDDVDDNSDGGNDGNDEKGYAPIANV